MKKAVIFDYDGVLVNTEKMLFDIYKEYNPDKSRQDYKNLSNGNFHELAEKAIEDKDYNPHPEYHTKYKEGLREVEITDSLKKLVFDLSQKYLLFIVSSNHSENIIEHLDIAQLRECFQMVWGFDFHTSKIFKIQKLLDEYKLDANEVVFVTDTLGDIMEGNICNVKSIGVTWGLHEREVLEKGEPVSIVDTVSELEQEILKILE